MKANRTTYICGEGSGLTLKKADQEALAMLISQISTHVESNFTLLKEEMSQNGNSEEFNETFNSVINTYSNATLKNTERIVLGNEPDAKVFRYIKRDEIVKVFQDRKDKIIGFTKNAEKSIEKKQIADGLRYYYWALTLLKSHPEGGDIEYIDQTGQKHLLATWLPMQLNNVFAAIDISVVDKETEDGYALYTMDIRHDNSQIENFDYSYWDGTDWSNLISARNGVGLVELYGVATDTEKLKIKAEYIFEGEARIDRELEDVLSKIDPVPFRSSYYTIAAKATETIEQPKKALDDSKLTSVLNNETYKKSIEKIIEAIKGKTYSVSQNEFTTEGYSIFTKLIDYGNAKVIGSPELSFIEFEENVICRAVPMSFNFKSNNKQFIEDVVFHFNKSGKVENLSFGLSHAALNDIIQKDVWKERDRLILVNFLENYKTAYALKRIHYIEQIFADDALIITGSVVKVKPNEINRYQSNRIIKYNKQTKQQYIKNLRYSFGSKEYINLKFEQSKIRKAGKGGDIYGVQIKQNYFSANYGDVGYLFLMVDLNNPDEPIIHVRTWQPDIETNDSVYGLSDFN
ncbi:MAG: LPP20 family lipoprotein [Salinivirgaceae bacterium]|nr:LPP20 family lipoprotein [Salinivirgaceae bacterium]